MDFRKSPRRLTARSAPAQWPRRATHKGTSPRVKKPSPTDPKVVSRLLKDLTGRGIPKGKLIASAATLSTLAPEDRVHLLESRGWEKVPLRDGTDQWQIETGPRVPILDI